MKSKKNKNDSDKTVGAVIAGASGLALGGTIAVVTSAPLILALGVGALCFAAFAAGGNSGSDDGGDSTAGWGG